MAADAFFRVGGIGEMIASVVDFFGLESQDVGRTCNYAEVAAFAAFVVDLYSTYHFCHILFYFLIDS